MTEPIARPLSVSDQRVIRVFISSTFRDMQEEREELVKRVFPQLRKLCQERGVAFTDVDLRWGITDEQKAEGKVLPICLEEINNCRPYFIGLLGERYGWIPDEIPRELIEQEPWLAERRGHSVTELEILHGVLNSPQMANRACFYFRDPAYVEHVAEAKKTDYVETDESAREKLAALKDRIRQSGLAFREGYPDPKTLGEWVLADLTTVLNQQYPPESKPEPLDREAADHETFAQSRAQVYIGRQEYFDQLDSHAFGDGPPLVMLGESGSGKSALLANWAMRYRAAHPKELLIAHFIGSSPYSTDWAAMLRRVMQEFRRRFSIHQDIPDKPDELRSAFANWLELAASRLAEGCSAQSSGKIILILDALNQLEDRDGALDLVWLPGTIPASIRLVLSTMPGRCLDNLNARGWPTLSVQPLQVHERRELIRTFLGHYKKSLGPARTERIIASPQSANPLFLRTLLDELRIFGSHDKLDARIEFYLKANTPQELFARVLQRWEEDYEQGTDLVGEALSLIWAARRGLSEAELLAGLGSPGQPLPRSMWSPLFLAMSENLVSRSGLLTFAHEFLRNAVRDSYLPSPRQQHAARLRLAKLFWSQEIGSDRWCEETPWQLCEGGHWRELAVLLKPLPFFCLLWLKNQFDTKRYWLALEANTNVRMVHTYSKVLETPEKYPDSVRHVAQLFHECGFHEPAARLHKAISQLPAELDDPGSRLDPLGNLALIAASEHQFEKALSIYTELEPQLRALGDEERLVHFLSNRSQVLLALHKPDAALRDLDEARQVGERLGDPKTLPANLLNKSIILATLRRVSEALESAQQAETLAHERNLPEIKISAMTLQAYDQETLGNLPAAMRLFARAFSEAHLLGDAQLVTRQVTALFNFTSRHMEMFIELFDAVDPAARKLLHEFSLTSLDGPFRQDESVLAEDVASFLYRQPRVGGLRDTLLKHRELNQSANASEDVPLKPGTEAMMLYASGEHDGAIALLKEEERFCQEADDPYSLAVNAGRQASVLHAQGELDAAMALYKQEESICRRLGDMDGLQRSLGNQALILRTQHDTRRAMTLLRVKQRICRKLKHSDGLQRSLCHQGLIWMDRGDYDRAMDLYKRAEAISRECDLPEGVAYSLANQGSLALQMRQPREAIELAGEAYRLATENGLALLAQQVRPILDEARALEYDDALSAQEQIPAVQQSTRPSCGPEELRGVLTSVKALLQQGDAEAALHLLENRVDRQDVIRNAVGVCQMRLGRAAEAVDCYRKLVLEQNGLSLRQSIPVIFKTNYATALLLSRNVSGCEWVLQEIDDENATAGALRQAIRDWKKSLSVWGRLSAAFGGTPKDIMLSFPPGEIVLTGSES